MPALLTVLLTALAAVPARADAPMPPPSVVEAASPHNTCVVRAEPRPARISVRRPGGPELWSAPFWTPNLVVSDDCGVVGAGYDRGALLVLDEKRPDTPVMTFFRSGRPTRTVQLGELYPDLSVLPRTSSHWLWLHTAEWSGTTWTVHTVDNRTLSFTP